MQFLIARASDMDGRRPPIPTATPIPLQEKRWRSEEPRLAWGIAIADLDDLMAFVTEHGDIVVTTTTRLYGPNSTTTYHTQDPDQQYLLDLPGIIIYDDYLD